MVRQKFRGQGGGKNKQKENVVHFSFNSNQAWKMHQQSKLEGHVQDKDKPICHNNPTCVQYFEQLSLESKYTFMIYHVYK